MDSIDSIEIDQTVLSLIPRETAIELGVLPLAVNGEAIVVALPFDHDKQTISDLAFYFGKKIQAREFSPEELQLAIHKHYGVSAVERQRRITPSESEFLSVKETEESIEDSRDPSNAHVSDGSVVALVNRLITDAIDMKASDIHVEPYEKQFRIRYRLDGVLHEMQHLGREKIKPLISRLKIMADLDIAEKRRPQDGRIRVRQGERTIDIRVSTLPTDFGEKVVLRILDKTTLQLDLAKLGLEEEALRVFRRTIRLPYGMILVTGPTGSGKTTTLYAALSEINKPELNITTIEDPIEYNLEGINQTHVRSDIGVTFAAALRSILRQDPNVIMVGEIRDTETAQIAVRAALTGHLVFSTLHTNDAPSAIVRLIDLGVEPFLVGSSLKLILAQRLVRKICTGCRELHTPTHEQVEELGLPNGNEKEQFFRGRGCRMCNQVGHIGRTAVFEILPVQNSLGDVIGRGISAAELRERAKSLGMLTLRQMALKKAQNGETSIEEVLRETPV